MAILTETMLRQRYNKEKFTSIEIEEGEKLTPSAKEFLSSRKIDIITKQKGVKDSKNPSPQEKDNSEEKKTDLPKKRYYFYDTGALFFEKPEYMTQIKGNKLVYKDDLRIKFRGQLDTLESEILFTMAKLKETKNDEVVQGLKQIYLHLRKMMRAEVLGEKLEEFKMFDLEHQTIREMSHYPKKYFGKEHFMLDGTEKMEVLLLNRIRTKVREVEVLAVETFKEDTKVTRPDILQSLNRLSSAVYFLMLKID